MTQRPPESKPARVLIIAGSDSGGGAGIQADLKTVTMLKGYAMTAVTAITAQDTRQVASILPVPPDMVDRQIQLCLADIGADIVKTGMLGSAALVATVADRLARDANEIPLIVDPVMVASSGDTLVEASVIDAIKSELIRGAHLVTPNLAEAQLLTGAPIKTPDDQRRAGYALLNMGAQSALIKGGHMSGPLLTDVLVGQDGEFVFESQRLITTSTHGTGCTLASAIAVLYATSGSLPDAVERGRSYVHHAIGSAPGFGQGHGPLLHNWRLFDQQD